MKKKKILSMLFFMLLITSSFSSADIINKNDSKTKINNISNRIKSSDYISTYITLFKLNGKERISVKIPFNKLTDLKTNPKIIYDLLPLESRSYIKSTLNSDREKLVKLNLDDYENKYPILKKIFIRETGGETYYNTKCEVAGSTLLLPVFLAPVIPWIAPFPFIFPWAWFFCGLTLDTNGEQGKWHMSNDIGGMISGEMKFFIGLSIWVFFFSVFFGYSLSVEATYD